MYKNVASQKIAMFAFNQSTGAGQAGDSANLTFYVSQDFGALASVTTSTITEVDSVNAKGWYVSSYLTQGETNGNTLLFTGKSGTSSVSVVGQQIYTLYNNFTLTSVDASGRVDLGKILGSAVDTTTTQLGVRVNNFNGNAFDSTAAQVGVRMNNIAGSAVDTTQAQLGVRVNNFNGNAFDSTAAQVGVRVNNIVANAVDTTSAQLGVRVVNMGAAALTSTSAQVGVNIVGIGGSALDTTAAQIGVRLVNIGASAVDTTSVQLGVRVNNIQTGPINSVTDGFLDRDMNTGTDTSGSTVRTPRQALYILRNKTSINSSSGTLTVTKTDDTTASWTASVSTDSTALPITAIDPQG